jgi:ABC-type antimicrobial peptide transport system permease subunit
VIGAVSGGLERMLFEITGTDLLTLASVGVLLVLLAAVTIWVPALRAARLHPVESLRAE